MSFHITRDTNYDDLFSYLEKTVAAENQIGTIVFSPADANNRHLFSCVSAFVERYKRILDVVSVSFCEHSITVAPAPRFQLKPDGYRYDELSEAYDETYYLTDCGGYDEFQSSHGKELDIRLRNMLTLVDPRPKDIILDVGCGRGELSYHLSKFCQRIIGIDYSKDAIRLAKETYDKETVDEKLSYISEDIITFPLEKIFDKIVLADVYEHIDAAVMERLLEKLAAVLKPDGKIYIHTAPNRDWYETVYPIMRKEAWQRGEYLPKNPRSYYEKLMHINEQSPRSLYSTLTEYFAHVLVWTGNPSRKEDFNQFPVPALSNDIFAVASLRELNDFMNSFFMTSLSGARLDFRISILSAACRYARGQIHHLSVRLENQSSVLVQSRPPYPVHLAYHLLTPEGEMIVFDGKRTPLSRKLYPGESVEMWMKLSYPLTMMIWTLILKMFLRRDEFYCA